jgi:membrane fusion protein (multidrug efflux system)
VSNVDCVPLEHCVPLEVRRADDDGTSFARATRGHGRRAGLTAVAVLAAGICYGLYAHADRDSATRAVAVERQAIIPDLRTVRAVAINSPRLFDLPGSIEPEETAALSARASGYIARRFVDIGSPVKTDQVLAVIRSPELDQQVSRARAALAQAQANWQLAAAKAQRSGALVRDGWVSRQNWDNDRLTEGARRADLDAAAAALAEAVQRQSYLTVTAPFDGAVTTRNVETGNLVSADDAQAKPLFVVARTDRLRVRVYVPQEAASAVKPGVAASVLVPEFPGRIFAGHVARTASALTPGTRTLPAEVDVDNSDGALTAGLYATVRFGLPRTQAVILVKSESLIYLADGLHVATVDEGGVVSLRRVMVGRDFGNEVEIVDGLPDGSQVALNPPAFLRDGLHVKAQPPM